MGSSTFIEMESGAKCPHSFTQTGSKHFAWWWALHHALDVLGPDHIGSIAAHLDVDTGPLKTVGDAEEYDLAANLENAGDDPKAQAQIRGNWERSQERNKDSWHPPAEFTATLETFLGALRSNPQVFKILGIEEAYFVKGYFAHDLSDILTAARWAQEQDEASMRLVIA